MYIYYMYVLYITNEEEAHYTYLHTKKVKKNYSYVKCNLHMIRQTVAETCMYKRVNLSEGGEKCVVK